MNVSRRSLRKVLVVVGCMVGHVTPGGAAVGTVLLVAGAWLHWLSKAYLEQNRALTTAGPYRFTRNPFYLANGLIDASILCWIGEPIVAVVFVPLWIAAYHKTIRGEEERLRELFGERFEAYASRVPRLLPTRRPLEESATTGKFDWANPSLAEGREYARLLGIALSPAAIAAAEILRQHQLSIFLSQYSFQLGWVLFVPGLWIVKLALAETFRRPSTRLLPSIGAGYARSLMSVAASLPLVAALTASGDDGHGIAAVLVVTGALVLSTRDLTTVLRVTSEAAFGMAVVVLGWSTGELWLAVGPMLFSMLALLDTLGAYRNGGLKDSDPSAIWPYLSRIATGFVIAMTGIGAYRVWNFFEG